MGKVIHDARGPLAWFLRSLGFAAVTMPWRRIYVLPEHGRHQGLLRHELVHVEQIDRDGAWVFAFRYLWWLIIYGYWNNPYEVEAYDHEPINEE